MAIHSLDVLFFPNLEPVCCSLSNSTCCFLTCIQISQGANQAVCYSHLFRIFQFIVIHRVKGFGIVKKVEIDVFQNSLVGVLIVKWMLAIWSLVPLPFLKPSWTSGNSWFMYCWNLGLENFEHYFTRKLDEFNCVVVWALALPLNGNPLQHSCLENLMDGGAW